LKAVVWICSSRPRVRDHFASIALDGRIEFLSGLVALTRQAGSPDIICIDAGEHDMLISEIVIKTLLRFPGADLIALLEDQADSQVAALMERGLDGTVGPESEWVSEVRRRLEGRAQMRRLGWIGKSEQLRQLASQVLQVAPAQIAVLITGASGTGKELIARALHDFSPRAARPFVPINTGAIPEALLESELFGHEKGAFTGAVSRRVGIFESAHGGTVFLDEIGEMPQSTQVKLLRVLESRRFRRVGGTAELETDVRIVSATNRNLTHLEGDASFRRDLYYRISAISIHASPLSERRADILPLLFHFWENQAGLDAAPASVEPDALRLLWNYAWPGNVRELRNFAEAAIVEAGQGPVTREQALAYIQRQRGALRNLPVLSDQRSPESESELLLHAVLHLGQQIREMRRLLEIRLPEKTEPEPSAFHAPAKSMADAERRAIEAALIETGGNRREAARRLGIGERTLYRKIKEYELR